MSSGEMRGNDLLPDRDANIAEPERVLSAHFGLDLINEKRVPVPAPDRIARFHGAERRFGARGLFIAHPPLVGSRAAWHRRWRLAIQHRNIPPDGRHRLLAVAVRQSQPCSLSAWRSTIA